MSQIISEEAVRHIALLSRLECSDAEIHRFAGDLNAILEYVEKLRELDTDAVEPTSHAMPQTNVFRDDEVRPSLSNEQALANAPEAEEGHFRVPPIIQQM